MPAVARTEALTKTYGQGAAAVVALDEVDVRIQGGEFTAIMGPSGSGKSTLMHLLAGLDRPTSGKVFLADVDIFDLDDDALTELRRDRVGFVFQAFNLVPTLTARENIVLPAAIAGRQVDQELLENIITTLDLGSRLTHKPSQLSGGQQQRVACARALVTRPDIVFADEPTGNLDSQAGEEVLKFLRHSADDLGQTIVMVTHDPIAAAFADRAIFLADGRIVADEYSLKTDQLIDLTRHLYAGPTPPRIDPEYPAPRRAVDD